METVQNAGVADIYTQGINRSGLLPLKLVAFNAVYQAESRSALLSWQTAGELSTGLFEVQKSAGATDFYTIGKVNAAGNSAATVNYDYTDLQPFKAGQAFTFYRLKMVDNNGPVTFTKTVRIRSAPPASLSVYPNPAINQLTFSFDADRYETTAFSITDAKGNRVAGQPIRIRKGKNAFTVNISFLPAGEYFIRAGNEHNYNGKFIKVQG